LTFTNDFKNKSKFLSRSLIIIKLKFYLLLIISRHERQRYAFEHHLLMAKSPLPLCKDSTAIRRIQGCYTSLRALSLSDAPIWRKGYLKRKWQIVLTAISSMVF